MNGKIEKHTEYGANRLQPLGSCSLRCLSAISVACCGYVPRLKGLPTGSRRSRSDAKTARLLSFLSKAFERHIFLHEKCLFPLIRSLSGARESIGPVLAQLEFEHASDHGLVLEITSAFLNGSSAETGVDVHVLGFLLRSFFENYRRHHAWENAILYPIARQLMDGTIGGRHDAILRVSLGFDA